MNNNNTLNSNNNKHFQGNTHSQIQMNLENHNFPSIISLPLFLENDIFNSKKVLKYEEKSTSLSSLSNKNILNGSNCIKGISSFSIAKIKENKLEISEKFKYEQKRSKKVILSEYAGLVSENKRYSITNTENPDAPVSEKNDDFNYDNSLYKGN